MSFSFRAFLLSPLLATASTALGQEKLAPADSMEAVLVSEWIDADFRRAHVFARLEKFALAVPGTTPADSVFYPAFRRYAALYEALPPPVRPHIFSATFYERALPVAQTFRHVGIVSTLTGHAAILHPQAPAPDPKHHAHDSIPHAPHPHK